MNSQSHAGQPSPSASGTPPARGANPLRLALLGCGSFGERHAHALQTIRSAELASVFDALPDRATQLSRSLDVPAAKSLDDIWSSDSIDAVIIATPTDTHRELTTAAANTGKHVLVEKPAALTLSDLSAMQQTCDDCGVVLFVGQTLRYHPVSQSFRNAIETGAVGDPVYFNWIGNARRPWPGGWDGWQASTNRSGGMLLHLGIHSIDLALWMLGERPARVFAQGVKVAVPGMDAPNFVQISIRCENGANALLELHTNLRGSTPSYLSGRLIGTHGQAEWALNDDGVAFTDDGTSLLFTGYDSSLKSELLHFIDCCSGKSVPLVTAEQSLNALTVALAAVRSLERNEAVEIHQIVEELA